MIYSSEPSITLKMIIESGILKAESKLFSSLNKNISGILKVDGSIELKIGGEVRNFPYPSGAARAIESRSLNGWKYWTVFDSGEYRDLSYYRDIYIEKLNDVSKNK